MGSTASEARNRGGLDAEQRDPRVGRDSVTRRKLVFGLALAEDVLYAAVALVLVGIAVALLYQTLHDLFTEEHITFALVALLLVIALVLIRRSPSGTDDG